MDAIRISTLIAELEAQSTLLSAVSDVEVRAAAVLPGEAATVEGLGYQLHNLYNACEDLFTLVASAFENQIEAAEDWHRGLIRRMSLSIEGVRPALIRADTASHMNELRAFRHFFRHAYAATLDVSRVMLVLDSARAALPLLHRDTAAFIRHLRALL